jgi:SPP1 gp7 family putative phage head morphogenesis protein
MTQNEARANVGLEPIKGGDEILLPFGMSKDTSNTDEQKKKNKTVENKHPLENKELKKAYGKLKVAREKENEKIFARYLNKFFGEQRDRLIDSIAPTNIKIFRKKGLLDEAFIINKEIKLTATEFLPLLTKFLKDAGSDTYTAIGNERYNFILSAEIASWLDKKANIFAEQITTTTFERLKIEFTESLELQETRQQLIKRIEDSYKDGGKVINKDRANLIARTEVGGAMTKGTYEAYNQAGVPTKIWVTVGDENVRHSHAEQDGQKKGINEPFTNGLQYPREAGMPADEVIGCRCQI